MGIDHKIPFKNCNVFEKEHYLKKQETHNYSGICKIEGEERKLNLFTTFNEMVDLVCWMKSKIVLSAG